MAIVKDKSGNSPFNAPGAVDRPYLTPNRSGAATPYAAVTPAYTGEIYEWKDATGNEAKLFRAVGLTSSDWARVTPTLQPTT